MTEDDKNYEAGSWVKDDYQLTCHDGRISIEGSESNKKSEGTIDLCRVTGFIFRMLNHGMAQRMTDCVNLTAGLTVDEIREAVALRKLMKSEIDVLRIPHCPEYDGDDRDYVITVWDSIEKILELFPDDKGVENE